MKKLLLVTMLALSAAQATASNAVLVSPSQLAYRQKFSQCLQAGWTAPQCYQALNAMPSPTPQIPVGPSRPSSRNFAGECYTTSNGQVVCAG